MLKEYEKELLILGTNHGRDISGYHAHYESLFSASFLDWMPGGARKRNQDRNETTRHIHVASVEEKLHLGRRLSFLLLSSPFPASSRTNLLA